MEDSGLRWGRPLPSPPPTPLPELAPPQQWPHCSCTPSQALPVSTTHVLPRSRVPQEQNSEHIRPVSSSARPQRQSCPGGLSGGVDITLSARPRLLQSLLPAPPDPAGEAQWPDANGEVRKKPPMLFAPWQAGAPLKDRHRSWKGKHAKGDTPKLRARDGGTLVLVPPRN